MAFAIQESIPVNVVIVGMGKTNASFCLNNFTSAIGHNICSSLSIRTLVASTTMDDPFVVNCDASPLRWSQLDNVSLAFIYFRTEGMSFLSTRASR